MRGESISTEGLDKKSILILCVAVILGIIIGIVFQKYVGIDGVSSSSSSNDIRPAIDETYEQKNGEYITITTRYFDTEGEDHYEYTTRDIFLDECALILIDIWSPNREADDPEDDRQIPHAQLKIVPLLELARINGMEIIHANHGGEVAEGCEPLEGEFVLDTPWRNEMSTLTRHLDENNINTLFYAGYATNMCIINRPVGIINMSRSGYDVILLRDCTEAVESLDSAEGEWAKEMAIHMVECNWGFTTTMSELERALQDRKIQPSTDETE